MLQSEHLASCPCRVCGSVPPLHICMLTECFVTLCYLSPTPCAGLLFPSDNGDSEAYAEEVS